MIVVMIAVYVLINILIDIAYKLLDPRVQLN